VGGGNLTTDDRARELAVFFLSYATLVLGLLHDRTADHPITSNARC
jgi:hypothetical protein